ncbi:hypothetical protein ACOME3_005520 [Neoechinorhynchus agilis]
MFSSNSGSVRVWIDGCFDLVHFGHANACRQAKQMGNELIVGLHSDEEIQRNKGPPVFSLDERCELVSSIKWVDECVAGAPYITTVATLDRYRCDFCVHGDDITLGCDGIDTYTEVKSQGRYKECKRTAGVSTTDIVGLLPPRGSGHHCTKSFDFLASSKRISQFANNKDPKPSDRIVYVDGGFDLFHIGHVRLLKLARQFGDYLVVGLHSDAEINRIKGKNYPIMNVNERLLSVLACKYVDDVFIGVPYTVSEEILDAVKPTAVVHGTDGEVFLDRGQDPYRFAKNKGVFKQINTQCDLTVDKIIDRIMKNRMLYVQRNADKEKQECEHLERRF